MAKKPKYDPVLFVRTVFIDKRSNILTILPYPIANTVYILTYKILTTFHCNKNLHFENPIQINFIRFTIYTKNIAQLRRALHFYHCIGRNEDIFHKKK